MNIDLIVRGDKWGVQLDVKSFPVFCKSCNSFSKEIYEHKGSRYGQVGSVTCECGQKLNLTDSDNIVEYIIIHSNNDETILDFKELYKLRIQDFETLKSKYGFDIYKEYLNQTIDLTSLIKNIEQKTGILFEECESEFPAPSEIRKWLWLMNK